MSGLTEEQLSLETDDTKCCTKCNEIKPLYEFGFHSRGRKFTDAWCSECTRKRSKEKSILNYGITLKDYDRMFVEQNGKCKICGTEKVGNKQCGRFNIDHDHKTNKVRGLLCHSCNLLLDNGKDDPKILMAAAQYLIGANES